MKPIINAPMQREITYIPILDDYSGNEISVTYVMWIRLGAHISLDGDHLLHPCLCVGSILRTEELIQSGIAKYRDSLIPKYVHEDLITGKCKKIILDYSSEGHYDIEWDYISTLFGVEKSKIIWVTSIWKPEFLNPRNEVTVIFDNFWERFLHGQIIRTLPNSLESILDSTFGQSSDNSYIIRGARQQIKDIKDLKIRPYHGLSYNRQPNRHRLYLISKLKTEGLIDSTAYSWGGLIGYDRPYWERSEFVEGHLELAKENRYLNQFDDESFRETVNSKRKEFSGEDLSINKAHNVNFDHIKDCYFQIISETMVINARQLIDGPQITPFLSEKSYKPFISCMPFVMWGQRGTVKALREQNYNCYDEWIDHSYDEYQDDGKRLEILMIEIKRLYAIPPLQWSLMLKEMIPIIEFNIEQLNKNSITSRLNTHFGEFNYNNDGRQSFILNPDVLNQC